ncbi:MAG TPA: hypothetical protein VF945_00895, partial [Polyangia bacterium]
GGGAMFLTLMVIGLAGLLVMALPAFARHGTGGAHAGHHALHVKTAATLPAHAQAHATHALVKQTNAAVAAGPTRFIPSPRLIFSVLALYGAFGNALVRAAHLPTLVAALVAVLPAAAVERFAVTPLWNLLFRFEGRPSAPLEELVLCDATAVTAFRNGRGIVSIVRDGRLVQFSARLVDAHAAMEVRVGDRLRVEDLDARRERLIVSLAQG